MLKKKLGSEAIESDWDWRNGMGLDWYFKIPSTLIIPEECKEIGAKAFERCYSLKEVVIPESVKVIGEDAFYYCEELRRAEIPSSVRRIRSYAFSRCSKAEIKLGKLGKSRIVERCAFWECKKVIRE